MSAKKIAVQYLPGEYNSKNSEEYFQVDRHEMLKYVPRDARRILDVGCAAGSFGNLLKINFSVEVWGIEPNRKAATIAANRLDKVICGNFSSELDLPKSHFDCIVFNDVLEHLVDPYSALVYCRELLSEKGVVIASIPNVRYFDNIWNLLILKKWDYIDSGILDKTHLRFFTCVSIEKTFNQLEYSIEHLEGINPLENNHSQHIRRFKFLNWISPKRVEDMRYLQFAVIARPNISRMDYVKD